MKLRRRVLVRVISYMLAVAVSVLTLFLMKNKEISNYKTQIEYGYSMHLNELDGSLYNISVALQKALYASTATQLSSIAVELCSESTVAKNSISQLPYSVGQFDNVNRFLSQVGDYTLYLSKKVIEGNTISEEERENLHNMSKTARLISSSVGVVRSEYDSEGVWSEELAAGLDGWVDSTLSISFEGLEELLIDSPSLVYDGPFSDHLLNGTLKMIDGKPQVTPQEAKEKAAKVLNMDKNILSEAQESGGNLPCYNFYGDNIGISITKYGGYVVYMRKYSVATQQNIEFEEAVEIADNYINSATDGNFVSTYYFTDEGVCTVNFAHKEGATLCYPDLIKVGVSVETGEVVLLEAGGYLANHYTRTISTPKYSVDDARKVLSDKLNIVAQRRVIIPTDGKNEKHCYEFDCRGIDGEELLVYVNVDNLEEEKILLLLKTDGGVLTK